MRHRTTVVMSLKWQHSPFLDRSNSDDFECFLEVCFGHYAFVETGADDERIRFGRAMSGQARQKLPPTFSTSDPSYFIVASTPGRASPTALTVSKPFDAVCALGTCLIAGLSQARQAFAQF
jgi:hypothetical protein